MKAGQFNIEDYLEKLYEEATPMMDGGEGLLNAEGIIIPDTNKKSYDWLKKEYTSKQVEVKVEISGQGASFKPGYDLQTNLDSVKDFKPGMFGEVKTADSTNSKGEPGEDKKTLNSLDAKKEQSNFQKGEGNKPIAKNGEEKGDVNKTKAETGDINNKEGKKPENGEAKVKKMDLKTKKTETGEKEEKEETGKKEEKEEKEETGKKEEKDEKEEKNDNKK